MFVSCSVQSSLGINLETGEVQKPHYIRVTKIDEDSVEAFARQITEAEDIEQPIIPIIIDSYGGDPYALMSMGDILKGCKAKIATVVIGKAMSCGAVLLSYGSEGYRFVAPSATVMIHDAWDEEGTRRRTEDMKADAAELDRLNRILFTTMARNVGKPDDYFMKIVSERHRTDVYITPEDALKHNLANHVCIPRLVKTISVSYDLRFEDAPSAPKKSRRRG